MEYVNLRTGGITAEPIIDGEPVNNGVYLKSIVKQTDDVIAFFPTTSCLTIFDGQVFSSEMKFNLFKKSHPDYERQCENLRKLIMSQGIAIAEAYTTRLTHNTDAVAVVDDQGIYLPRENGISEMLSYHLFEDSEQFHADAIVTNQRNVALVMYCADCPTALLRDKVTGAIGVLHSTWRGLVIDKEDGSQSSIIKTTIATMARLYDTKPEDLEVTIFPCIGLDQYEVGDEVVNQYDKHLLGECIHYCDDGHPHLDLVGAVIKLCERYGVKRESIELTPYSTADYGFNSLRMAPVNYKSASEIDVKNISVSSDRPRELRFRKSIDSDKLFTSALNVLVAFKN